MMSGALRGIVREPLVHFALLAGSLFVLGAIFDRGDDVIEVSRAEIEWRILQIEAELGDRLTAEERRQVEETYIEERVLVREAQAIGLTDDERIDDILIQKMLHVLSGDVIQPTDEELAAYYDANPERYRRAAEVTVDEVVVADGAPLPHALRAGGEPEELPEGALIALRNMPELELDDLVQLFGPEAAEQVFEGEVDAWVGPFPSVRGQHWLRVRERLASQTPPLDEVRDLVRRDWIAAEEDRRLADRVAELRTRYTVIVDDGREP
jgi:peptidyl-prolyl cis-trans isomerase C